MECTHITLPALELYLKRPSYVTQDVVNDTMRAVQSLKRSEIAQKIERVSLAGIDLRGSSLRMEIFGG